MLASQSCTSSSQSLAIYEFDGLTPLSNERDKYNHSRERWTDGVSEGAGLAHDAGNILGALSLYAELLAGEGVSPDEYRAYADEIRLLAERSNVLIERLAGYTRPVDSTTASAILPHVVNNYGGLLSRIIRRPFEITVGPHSSHPIRVSTETVERILLNLVKNAAAATPLAGMISVAIEGSEDTDECGRHRVVLTVRDDGSGMSKSTQERLRGSVGRPRVRQRGLGLRIVRELVDQSGGLLDVDSYPGYGTKVSVTWFENQANVA